MVKFAFQVLVQRFSLIAQKVTIVLLKLQMKLCTTILVIKDSSVLQQQVMLPKQETIVLKLTSALLELVSTITLQTQVIMTIGEQMLLQDVQEALVMIQVTLKCSCSNA
jgi:hypothetical protein